MTLPSTGELLRDLHVWVRETFLYMRPDFVLGDDDRLLRQGVIDSMGVMELLAHLEEAYGVIVPEEDLTEANLGTLRAVADYVVRARTRASAA